VRKRQPDKHPFITVEEECLRVLRRGWVEMIRIVYEVNRYKKAYLVAKAENQLLILKPSISIWF
jgi:hypothetical protein